MMLVFYLKQDYPRSTRSISFAEDQASANDLMVLILSNFKRIMIVIYSYDPQIQLYLEGNFLSFLTEDDLRQYKSKTLEVYYENVFKRKL